MMDYPTKAENLIRPSGPDGDGKSPGLAAASIEANTEKPITTGDAAAAKAENTAPAEASPKAENGSSNTSPAPAKETESRKAENVLVQMLQQAAANLAAGGVHVAVSEGRMNGAWVVRFSVYESRICRECKWVFVGDACMNRKCKMHGVVIAAP